MHHALLSVHNALMAVHDALLGMLAVHNALLGMLGVHHALLAVHKESKSCPQTHCTLLSTDTKDFGGSNQISTSIVLDHVSM